MRPPARVKSHKIFLERSSQTPLKCKEETWPLLSLLSALLLLLSLSVFFQTPWWFPNLRHEARAQRRSTWAAVVTLLALLYFMAPILLWATLRVLAMCVLDCNIIVWQCRSLWHTRWQLVFQCASEWLPLLGCPGRMKPQMTTVWDRCGNHGQ
jgi:hypothetical protein